MYVNALYTCSIKWLSLYHKIVVHASVGLGIGLVMFRDIVTFSLYFMFYFIFASIHVVRGLTWKCQDESISHLI